MKQRQKQRETKSGETIVEVVVSVVIFLMLVAMIHTTMNYCYSAQMRSANIHRELVHIEELLAMDQSGESITDSNLNGKNTSFRDFRFQEIGSTEKGTDFDIHAEQSVYQFAYDTGNKYTFIKLYWKK